MMRDLRTGIVCVLLLGTLGIANRAGMGAFDRSVVSMRDGTPQLLVDGQPFFFFGAAFFYERIPAAQWRSSMLALRTMGFNTLDLYVPWNWHELADGDFDFDGRTDARRNLRGVLELSRELHFRLIVRPGPVIRNEWRNGGYPAWLLARPEYGMPLHDVLEGRYPATATRQNANADDAASEWMRNATHLAYARRWLHAALREFAPVADRVLAVQLDDDQSAYIDNQTWPAPHEQAYLRLLEGAVRETVGPQLPVFINTYEMKVTASAPVWAMGNWYQSDAYSIGEHDRAALEFSTGLLQTQTRFPVAMSEFQAGWLAAPEDPLPRPADPTNTTLALHTLLAMGARGVIDFPAQDTRNPDGWEAPFANAAYAWDAALDVDLRPSSRYTPTARFGAVVRRDGAALADAHRLTDGAIAYLTSAYDERTITNADIFAIAARTMDAQHECRGRRLTCDLVDLRFAGDATLRRYPFVVVPAPNAARRFIPAVTERLARYRAHGGRVVAHAPAVATPRNGGIADATLLLAGDGTTGLLDIVNFDVAPRVVARTSLALPNGRSWTIGPLTIAARDAVLLRSDLPATTPDDAPPPDISLATNASATAMIAQGCDPARDIMAKVPAIREEGPPGDGGSRLTLANGLVALTVAPAAGARAFSFIRSSPAPVAGNSACPVDVFTSVGSLRDDVEQQPPLSTTDRIGKYTRSFPAGMFNRPYRVERRSADAHGASLALVYDAPDVVPAGAHFERTVTIVRDEAALTVRERVLFAGDAALQRPVRYDSFDTRNAIIVDERTLGSIGFFYPGTGLVASVSWPSADVEDVQLLPERSSTVVRLRFAAGGERRTRYGLDRAATIDAARIAIGKERDAVAANR